MTTGMKTILYPVTDLDGAKQVYGALLGVPPTVDAPYYVGFDIDGQHIGLDPNGHGKGMTGPVGYWHVDDIERALKELVGSGAEVMQPASDVGGGKLVATATDADGNVIGLLQEPPGARA
jgi:predicted enzyme related to lactoylglutathione lyase